MSVFSGGITKRQGGPFLFASAPWPGGGGGGSAPVTPTAYSDSGTFAAAANKTTAVDNGLYDVLVRNGATKEWRRVFALDGTSTVTGPSGGNITRVQYYGPLSLTPQASGSYGPNLVYGTVWNSLGGKQYGGAAPVLRTQLGTAARVGADVTDTNAHQGFCVAGTNFYVTSGQGVSSNGVLKQYTRDPAHVSEWVATGVENTSPNTIIATYNHTGSVCYRAKNNRIYATVGDYPTQTKSAIIAFDASTLAYIGHWFMAGGGSIGFDGPCIDDTNDIIYCIDYVNAATVRRYNLATVEALASGSSAETGRLSDLTDPVISQLYKECQGSDFKNGIIYTGCKRNVGTGVAIMMRDAATGKYAGELSFPTSVGGYEGVSFDGSQVGVIIGTAPVAQANFFDIPAAPTYTKSGLNVNGDHGIVFGSANTQTNYSVMAAFRLTSTANDAAKGGRPSAWDHIGSSTTHECQVNTTGTTVVANGASVSTLTSFIASTFQTAGGSYQFSDGSTIAYAQSNNVASVTTGPTTGSSIAKTTNAVMGMAAHVQNGRLTGSAQHFAYFSNVLTGAQMEALRLDYTLLWDATDGLSAGQKSAAEAT